MAVDQANYVFINSGTGNVIGYCSLPAGLPEKDRDRSLELRRAEIAVKNRLLISKIYWQLQQRLTAGAGS